jgi:mannose-1-phosphate guanylyltransferase
MDKHTYCVIMAGGRGERFWPLSTDLVPKPFVRLIGDQTMIQMTVARLSSLAPEERTFVVLGREHLAVARSQLPGLAAGQFIVEPEGKDTAPCIGFAAVALSRLDPEALMVVVPADHYIPDAAAFVKTVSVAAECARQGDCLVTIGVRPTRPEVGYGYIFAAESAGEAACGALRVGRYVEKPDEAKAAEYLADGRYYWNSGIFVWRAGIVLEGIASHMPQLAEGLAAIRTALDAGTAGVVEERFRSFQKISIDYGLMEKAANVLMVKADFAWDDVGTWGSLRRVLPLDENGNYITGSVACLDAKGCVICGQDAHVGAVGVEGLIIVASREGVLVCDMGRDQETRQIARMVGQQQKQQRNKKKG